MLFFLTGNIQTGKTRWLSSLVSNLEQQGATCFGVLAPGIWEEKGNSFIKTGITNELLPAHETYVFAYPEEHEKGWAFSEEAIKRINSYFESELMLRVSMLQNKKVKPALIIDELGYLELQKQKGIISALNFLKKEDLSVFSCVICVVRESLLNIAHTELKHILPCTDILPDNKAQEKVLETILTNSTLQKPSA